MADLLCTLPYSVYSVLLADNTQRPNPQSLIGRITSTFTIQYYYYWHFFIIFFYCCFTALSALFHSIFSLMLHIFLGLFHVIFSLLFHSIFDTISQYLLFLQIIIGTISKFFPGHVTVLLYCQLFSSFIHGCLTVQLYSRLFQLYSQPGNCTDLFPAMLLFRARIFKRLWSPGINFKE